jgi:hypothetical protein
LGGWETICRIRPLIFKLTFFAAWEAASALRPPREMAK